MARRLVVRLAGPRVVSGRLSVDDLGRLIQCFQLALKRTGLGEAGRPGKRRVGYQRTLREEARVGGPQQSRVVIEVGGGGVGGVKVERRDQPVGSP